MEQQTKQDVPEMPGDRPPVATYQTQMVSEPDRSFVETQRTHLTNMIVWAISGCVIGINVGQWVMRMRHSVEITATIILTLLLIQIVWLTRQGMNLRRWTHELRAERLKLLEMYKAKVDELLPNDPIEAARIKMRMEEQWPIP